MEEKKTGDLTEKTEKIMIQKIGAEKIATEKIGTEKIKTEKIGAEKTEKAETSDISGTTKAAGTPDPEEPERNVRSVLTGIGKRILNNWPIKLLSLGLALLIWVVVVNVNDPTQTVTITGIPIQIVNDEVVLDSGQVYTVVGSPRASIRVTQRRSVISGLSPEDFTAVADFNTIYRENQVPVTITSNIPTVSASNITQITQSLEIRLESMSSATVPVEVLTIGEPAEGYTLGDITTSRQSIVVRAPQGFNDRLRSATVTVDVSGASQPLEKVCDIVLRDAYGSDMLASSEYDPEYISMSTSQVSVTVEVRNMQTVSITADILGIDEVASGYRYIGYTITPDKIDVQGLKTTLARISSIVIEDERLTVEDAQADVEVTIDITEYLPQGIYLNDPANKTVVVTMKIEQLEQQTIQLPVTSLTVYNAPENLEMSFVSDTFDLTVSGLAEDISQLSRENLRGSIYLDGLEEPGEYTVDVELNLPDGFRQIGTATTAVRLVDPTAETTTAAAETGTYA